MTARPTLESVPLVVVLTGVIIRRANRPILCPVYAQAVKDRHIPRRGAHSGLTDNTCTVDRMSIRHTAAALGIAAAIAGLGGAAVYAATDSQGPGSPLGMNGPQDRPAPATPHSEAVLADRDGGYTTDLTQTGTITVPDGNLGHGAQQRRCSRRPTFCPPLRQGLVRRR